MLLKFTINTIARFRSGCLCFIITTDRYLIRLISGVLCLIFFLFFPHITVHKVNSPWAEHQWELPVWQHMEVFELRWKDTRVKCERGKRNLSTWETRKLLKSFGSKSVPGTIVGEERNSCAYYHDKFPERMAEFTVWISFRNPEPKTAITPIWATLNQINTAYFKFVIAYISVASQRADCKMLQKKNKLGYAFETCRNHWFQSVSNQRLDFISPCFNQPQSKQMHCC